MPHSNQALAPSSPIAPDTNALGGVDPRCGVETVGLEEGVILTRPSAFKHHMAKPIPVPAISSPLRQR
jgi:hypothetical protein